MGKDAASNEPALLEAKWMLLNEMSWVATEAYLRDKAAILIPIGSMEGHGPHLPLATDAIIAFEIAKRVSQIVKIAVAPPLTYTITALNRPGNVRLQPTTFIAVFTEIVSSFMQFGCRRFFVVLGHGGPQMKRGLIQAAEELYGQSGQRKIHVSVFHISRALSELGGINTRKDKHAGDWETSLMLALAPSLVGERALKEFSERGRLGVFGDPTRATPKKGERLVRIVVNWISGQIQEKQAEPGVFCNWK